MDVTREDVIRSERSAAGLIDGIEGRLDHIRQVARATMLIVEHHLDRSDPKAELATLLAVIEETVEEAEILRQSALAAARAKSA